MFSLYKSLVLPILEYGLPVWTPHKVGSINRLESIQRRATRLALKQRRGQMPYEERLQMLNWNSLKLRRTYCTMAFITKCLFKHIQCPVVNSLVVVNPRHLEDLKFRHLFARKDGLHFSAIHEFPRLWDTLPSDLRNSVLTVSFSTWCSHLKSHLADAP